jgi:hypothetical protein
MTKVYRLSRGQSWLGQVSDRQQKQDGSRLLRTVMHGKN